MAPLPARARPFSLPIPTPDRLPQATRRPPPSRTLRQSSSLMTALGAAADGCGLLQQTSCQASPRRESGPKGVLRLKAEIRSPQLPLREPQRSRGARRGDESGADFLST